MTDTDTPTVNVLVRPRTPAYLAAALGVVGVLAGLGLVLLGLSWADGATGLAAAGALFVLVGGGTVTVVGGGLVALGRRGLRTASHRPAAMASCGTIALVVALWAWSLAGGLVGGVLGLGVGWLWSRRIERAGGQGES